MITYKLCRIRNGHLYPLYVNHNTELKTGRWLTASIGEKIDATHVKANGCGGKLSLRPGFHSTLVPFTDWIGKRGPDGTLWQRPDTVWCECEVDGHQQVVTDRYGLRTIPSDWYFFKSNVKQKDPWIISNRIFIRRILSHVKVEQICREHGITAQPVFTES